MKVQHKEYSQQHCKILVWYTYHDEHFIMSNHCYKSDTNILSAILQQEKKRLSSSQKSLQNDNPGGYSESICQIYQNVFNQNALLPFSEWQDLIFQVQRSMPAYLTTNPAPRHICPSQELLYSHGTYYRFIIMHLFTCGL